MKNRRASLLPENPPNWIQHQLTHKKVGYLPQVLQICVYEYRLKRVDSESALFAHFCFMNTTSAQHTVDTNLKFLLLVVSSFEREIWSFQMKYRYLPVYTGTGIRQDRKQQVYLSVRKQFSRKLLKGIVARDFQHLGFFINQEKHLGPCFIS